MTLPIPLRKTTTAQRWLSEIKSEQARLLLSGFTIPSFPFLSPHFSFLISVSFVYSLVPNVS